MTGRRAKLFRTMDRRLENFLTVPRETIKDLRRLFLPSLLFNNNTTIQTLQTAHNHPVCYRTSHTLRIKTLSYQATEILTRTFHTLRIAGLRIYK